MRFLRIALPALVAIGCIALPATASAANYCVGSVANCTGSPVADFDADAAGIGSAIVAANANAGADNIYLAAGTYTLGSAFNPTFAATQDVHIIGAGVGQTVFTSSIASVAQLTFNFTTAASDVSGISLNVTGTPSDATGIQVFVGTLKDFSVNQPGGLAQDFHAVSLDGDATALRGSIALTSGNGVGIQFDKQVIGPDDSEGNAAEISMTGPAQASIGVAINSDNFAGQVLDRMRISGFGRGVEVTAGSFTVTNMLIDMRDMSGAQGFDAYNGISSSNIAADVSRLTVVGTGTFQTALSFGAGAAGTQTFSGGFIDVVLFTTDPGSTGLVCTGGATNLSATINSYAIRGAELNLNGCNPSDSNKTDLASVDPGFRDFAGGDFRLRPGSPLIDAGVVGETISPSERDLLGLARLVDGDGNGSTVVDLGAFEYQRTAPSVNATAASPSVRAEASGTFSASGTDADGETLSYLWSFDDGAAATGSSVSHTFTNPGSRIATVTVTDEAGLTASASVAVTVVPLPKARVTAKSKKAFARARKGFAAPKKRQPSFTVSFTERGKAKFTLQSIFKSKKLKRVRGSQVLKVKRGANKFAFNGKLGGKQLKPGKYRVTITPQATDGAVGKPVATDIVLK